MNVKPGDLAIVIKARGGGPIIGRIVHVVRPMVDDEIFISTTGVMTRSTRNEEIAWVIESEKPIPWDGRFYKQRPVVDSMLRPISGLPDTEETNEQEPIKEHA